LRQARRDHAGREPNEKRTVRILIATDAFPPRCGGSGWSTFELARGLRSRGHELVILQPVVHHTAARGTASAAGPGSHLAREYDGFAVREVGVSAPDVPYLRNYLKNERLYRRLAPVIRQVVREQAVDLVHAQHVLTIPPSVEAARGAGVPVVATVRDYWPVCYWSDLIYDRQADTLCPGCSASMMARCVRPRAPRAWPLALPLIPYMRRNLALKARALGEADAIIAVSGAIESDLRARAPGLVGTRIERIPNPVDCDAIERQAAGGDWPADGPYAIYVGKLAPNKGSAKLLPAIRKARLPWPLVVVGDGPDRAAVEREARAWGGDVRFTGWLPRAEALQHLRQAALVVFPSKGPESLSRVLLEAAALGRPVAAMDTGGTRDIVVPEVTGLLSATVEGLAADVARLVHDPEFAARLGEAARRHVRAHFDAGGVVARIEQLYDRVLDESRSRKAHDGA
jgi:glycogen(starch) synthase